MTTDTHPTLPEFDYVRPGTLAEASRFLVEHKDEARPFLGGTDLFVRMRDRFLSPRTLVDVKGLEGMRDLHYDPKEGLVIGAAVPMNRVIASPEVQAHYPLLAEACSSVASYQLRNRATVAGNICNASPAGDTLGACLVFDGGLQVHGVKGLRRLALASFFHGPGKTVLEPGDVVTAVLLPPPPPGSVGKYLKLGRNRMGDLALVGVTVLAHPEPSLASGFRFRVALASVAPTPLMLPAVEEFLAGQAITPAVLEQAASLAAEACRPIDDVRGSARYRLLMVRNLARQAFDQVWKGLGQA